MESLFAGLGALPNVHPLVVPLPIGLLVGSVILDLLALRFASLEIAGRWTLWLATAGAGLAVLTGHGALDSVQPFVTPDASALIERHHNIGFVGLGMAGVLSLWRLVAHTRWRAAYLALVSLTLAVVLYGADIGGQLVFRYGVGVSATADSLQNGVVRQAPHAHGE